MLNVQRYDEIKALTDAQRVALADSLGMGSWGEEHKTSPASILRWENRLKMEIQRSDSGRFVDGCTCRVGPVVQMSKTEVHIFIAGEDDCPVHGFGSE